ncbi:putative 2-oxoglutarate and Fe(II)-dependent oxygenase superfamily protein [Quillaja saponaria]|uniref:2-oxoglutarate and Fe(II)-dependent oxygenase superfamily protein n=1 Tax=Quillaja saponaria TaxID=32244 RepID=A0AAD7PT02_QUISA|nr:putative 2-oxoglutarate and Fe(II)-dependent oxygenase superfamily protein [Quillaja saponaria]
MNIESGLHVFIVNYYPPCPQPEIAKGLPPHTDFTIFGHLLETGHNGLQVQHDGKWVSVNPLPNSYLIHVGDQLEILTNGKYKSVVHKVSVNNKTRRMSIGLGYLPPVETAISPAPELVSEDHPPAFRAITYAESLELKQKCQCDNKSFVDLLRI